MTEGSGIMQTASGILAFILRAGLFLALFNRFVPLCEKSGGRRKIKLLIPPVKEYFFETVFVCLLYYNFRHLSYFAVNSVLSLISDAVMERALISPDIEAFVTKWVGFVYPIAHFLYVITIAALVLPAVLLVKRRIKMNGSEFLYLSVLNIAGIVLTRIMMGLAVISVDDGAVILTEERPSLLWQLPLVGLLLYLGELSAVFIWQRYDFYREKGQLYYAENMEKEAIKKRLGETEEYYDAVRRARHEMANHLVAIRGLADGNHNEKLAEYIAGIEADTEPVRYAFDTGDPVTDVVLSDKFRRASEKKISCDFSFYYDDGWGIAVYDLSIILSNILDNSIEAQTNISEEKRYIALRLTEKERLILIRCENACGEEKTSHHKKPDGLWHGIGLKNVKDIAARYDGAVDISGGSDAFIISVMMKKRPFVTQSVPLVTSRL